MKTYSPEQVSIILGAHIARNWESISIELDEDSMSLVSGADGEVTRVKNSNRIATATLNLKQASETNAYLSAQHAADAVFPITVKDNSGNSIHSIPLATIKKPATAEYGKEQTDRAWTMGGKVEINTLGGN